MQHEFPEISGRNHHRRFEEHPGYTPRERPARLQHGGICAYLQKIKTHVRQNTTATNYRELQCTMVVFI